MELASWVGVQARLMMHGDVQDCAFDLPEKPRETERAQAETRDASQAPFGSLGDAERDVNRGVRRQRRWLAPQWVGELRDRAHEQVPIPHQRQEQPQQRHDQRQVHVGQYVSPPQSCTRRLLAQVHATHSATMYSVADLAGGEHGHLVACTLCGGYAAKKMGLLCRPCTAPELQRGLAQQVRRIAVGRHPNCRAPADWRIAPLPELQEELMLPPTELEGDEQKELLTIYI
eukprot:2915319-Amphidinium_carterae.1